MTTGGRIPESKGLAFAQLEVKDQLALIWGLKTLFVIIASKTHPWLNTEDQHALRVNQQVIS